MSEPKTVHQHNAGLTGSVELETTRYIPVSASQKNENLARAAFERWAQEGTRPFMFALQRVAGDEYVSIYTEGAWKAFKAGWESSGRS